MRALISCLMLLLMLLSAEVRALSGSEHCQDALKVLGKENDAGYAQLAEAVSRLMDKDYTELLNELKSPMVSDGCFTLSRYTHRLFFHWGFNQSPRSQSALAEQVRRAVEDQNLKVLNEQRLGADVTRRPIDEEALWRLIETEWKKRRDAVLNKAVSVAGARQKGEALVVIIYNVHLLGDYSTSSVEALADVRVIAAELNAAISMLGGKSSAAAIKLTRKLSALSRRAFSTTARRECAASMLDLLKLELPAVIGAGQTGAQLPGKH